MNLFCKKNIDLHIHTNFSDGTFTPEEVVAYAIKSKLSAIAITDHDCIDGIAPCELAAQNTDLEIIPGVELSAEINNFEIHIVGLLIDYKQDWFINKLKEIRLARLERMKMMIEKINQLGIDIKLEEVKVLCKDDGAIGRLHLARALFNKGIISSVREAFDRFIGADGPCYVKRFILSPKEVIEMIRNLNGIPVFAHPGNMRHDEAIPELISYGLMALEAFHTDHNQRKAQHYTSLAKKYDLLLSGGSDCHGDGKGFPLMGRVKVPYKILEKMRKQKMLNLSNHRN
ncbi:MAG: PHP domain-containing protein [Candidatus Omnitrophica bacterium]|nr:PHP domain-containing protein [Candidatus Omnitrophota bacterium]